MQDQEDASERGELIRMNWDSFSLFFVAGMAGVTRPTFSIRSLCVNSPVILADGMFFR